MITMIATILLQVEASAWGELGKLGVVFLLMAIAIIWLVKKLEKTESKNDQLNTYIQGFSEKSISTLKDVQNMMDKVFDNQVNGNDAIKAEILSQNLELQKNLRGFIQDLLSHLPKSSDGTIDK